MNEPHSSMRLRLPMPLRCLRFHSQVCTSLRRHHLGVILHLHLLLPMDIDSPQQDDDDDDDDVVDVEIQMMSLMNFLSPMMKCIWLIATA